MEFLSPTSLADALAAKAAHPDAVPIMGGTDVMVELNFDRHRPDTLLDLTRVPELTTWDRVDGEIRLGAGVTYTRLIEELGTELPGLALASRTVGSIRKLTGRSRSRTTWRITAHCWASFWPK